MGMPKELWMPNEPSDFLPIREPCTWGNGSGRGIGAWDCISTSQWSGQTIICEVLERGDTSNQTWRRQPDAECPGTRTGQPDAQCPGTRTGQPDAQRPGTRTGQPDAQCPGTRRSRGTPTMT